MMETMGKRGRPANEDRSRRETRVLDVAQRLFIARGYAGTSIALLAKEAQVATRSVYAWYGGKQNVVRALIAREALRHRAELDELPMVAPMVGDTMFALARHVARRSRTPWLLRLRAIADHLGDPEVSRELHAAGLGLFEQYLRDTFASPVCRDYVGVALAPELLADLFIGCVLGAAPARPALLADPAEMPDAADGLAQRMRLFVNAILPGS